MLVAGLLMMIFGCFNKFSAFVVTIPDPIIGASFIVLFGENQVTNYILSINMSKKLIL